MNLNYISIENSPDFIDKNIARSDLNKPMVKSLEVFGHVTNDLDHHSTGILRKVYEV